jgi:transcription elongation factor Elf1
LTCRICKVEYEKTINKLTKEVDVYCAWTDEAEKRNKESGDGRGLGLVRDLNEEDEEQDLGAAYEDHDNGA